MAALRRSKRCASASYESNGRDHIAGQLGISREDFESWLVSSTVHPHLLLWYNLCVVANRRFNDAIQWVNTGEQGYFYNKDDLEEDLLLMCLCEGNPFDMEGGERGYVDEDARTSDWVTQELWARCAWRIVHNNCSKDQLFNEVINTHPAAAYGLVIDIICIAFHSIAFRRTASVWDHIIRSTNSDGDRTLTAIVANANGLACMAKGIDLDRKSDDGSASGSTDSDADPDSDYSSDVPSSDGTLFVPRTPERAGSVAIVRTPKAPKKASVELDRSVLDTRKWLDSLPIAEVGKDTQWKESGDSNLDLLMFDEFGVPITRDNPAQA